MYYVYLLQSKVDKSSYIGYTNNLKLRIARHNKGNVLSTKYKLPWNLLYFEGFINRTDAKKREVYLKSGWGRKSLSNMLKETLISTKNE